MAGHRQALKPDPAIERWYEMRTNMHQHFKYTRPVVRTGIVMMIIVPGALAWLLANQEMKWDWIGKRKGESLLRKPPAKLEEDS